MEDILASIRRIIADDQLQAGRSALGSLRRGSQPALSNSAVSTEQHEAPHDQFAEEVLDLAKMPDAVVSDVDQSPPSNLGDAEQAPDSSRDGHEDRQEVVAEPSINGYANGVYAPQPMAKAPAEPSEAEPHPGFGRSGSADHPTPQHGVPASGESDSLISPKLGASVMPAFESLAATVVLQNTDMLDRVMHDLMRPLIKSWLDENLPSLVERLVRVEIERVARGSRG